MGTPGFYAPEQMLHVDHVNLDTVDDFPFSEKTNVYGVGLILWCLMHKELKPPQPLWLGDPTAIQHVPLEPPTGLSYSAELKELVNRCLRYEPQNRPSFDQIIRRIQHAVNDAGLPGATDRSLGMRRGTTPAAIRIMRKPLGRPDPYRIGLARPLPDVYV